MIAEKDAGTQDVNQRLVKLCDGDAKRSPSFSLSADRAPARRYGTHILVRIAPGLPYN
jgi:hypothetical protein